MFSLEFLTYGFNRVNTSFLNYSFIYWHQVYMTSAPHTAQLLGYCQNQKEKKFIVYLTSKIFIVKEVLK